jgi:hypothetical protein
MCAWGGGAGAAIQECQPVIVKQQLVWVLLQQLQA